VSLEFKSLSYPKKKGGRDQEDHSSKPARANSSQKKKKIHHKRRAGGVAPSVGPEFKPQYCREKKKKRKPLRGGR
jgi:hypothetical protein